MNFTPNPTNAHLTGRVPQQQQQQVNQVAVTTSSGIQQSGSLQKNLPNSSFPVNQEATNQVKIIDDKPPTSIHHQQPGQNAQNNNNHGMGGIPPQLINVQHQSNINRNLNQTTFQQSPQHLMMTQSIAQAGPKVGIFQQVQQMAQQNLQFPQVPSVPQSQQSSVYHSGLPTQQNALQKLQTTIPQTVHTIKTVTVPTDPSGLPMQQKLQQTVPQSVQIIKTGVVSQQSQLQQLKPISSQPPPSISTQSMQYSPTKSTHPHPQMKTTAKLASPGSQLQSLQKSPTAPNQPQLIGQPTALQNKTVPSTPPALSPGSSAVSTSNPTPSQFVPCVSVTPAKNQAPNIPAKQLLGTVMGAQVASGTTNPTPSVPVHSVNVSSKPVTIVSEPILPKETDQSIPVLTKPVPKLNTDEKNVFEPENNLPAPETNNKNEKSPASSASAEKKQAVGLPPKATTPSKSTMRLATVTPARQKKPPSTGNNKKPVPTTPPIASVQKAPAKVSAAPAKVVEAPKTPANAKKPQTSVPATTPKSNPTPSTSSAQSNSSSASGSGTSPKTKRSRVKVQPYQSPTPELALVTKLSTQTAKSSTRNGNDDKLIIFYKNEFLAVRNPDGGFYLCQALHNVYKSSPKIRIHWLNDKNEGKVSETGGQIYVLDYYDTTDFECVLTTVDLTKIESKSFELSKEEQTRIESILKKAIDVEKGILPRPTVTEENPDGLDLSLYKDEAQLDKASPNKRKLSGDDNDDEDYEVSPRKKTKVKSETSAKRVKSPSKKSLVNDDSTESDEENLMEIKKKAKRQAANMTPSKTTPKKAPEPIPSTSKAAAITTSRSRKRLVAKSSPVDVVPEKVAKSVEKVEAVESTQTSPKTKLAAKPKGGKKSASEKTTPEALEKKQPVEKKTANKKADELKPAATPTKVVEKTPSKLTPKKKVTPKKATEPDSGVLEPRPSTSRSRNTRSKK